MEEEGILLNLFYKASITLNKRHHKKRKQGALSDDKPKSLRTKN